MPEEGRPEREGPAVEELVQRPRAPAESAGIEVVAPFAGRRGSGGSRSTPRGRSRRRRAPGCRRRGSRRGTSRGAAGRTGRCAAREPSPTSASMNRTLRAFDETGLSYRQRPHGDPIVRPTVSTLAARAPVAQGIERAPPEREVEGSNPSGRMTERLAMPAPGSGLSRRRPYSGVGGFEPLQAPVDRRGHPVELREHLLALGLERRLGAVEAAAERTGIGAASRRCRTARRGTDGTTGARSRLEVVDPRLELVQPLRRRRGIASPRQARAPARRGACSSARSPCVGARARARCRSRALTARSPPRRRLGPHRGRPAVRRRPVLRGRRVAPESRCLLCPGRILGRGLGGQQCEALAELLRELLPQRREVGRAY